MKILQFLAGLFQSKQRRLFNIAAEVVYAVQRVKITAREITASVEEIYRDPKVTVRVLQHMGPAIIDAARIAAVQHKDFDTSPCFNSTVQARQIAAIFRQLRKAKPEAMQTFCVELGVKLLGKTTRAAGHMVPDDKLEPMLEGAYNMVKHTLPGVD